MRTKDSGTLRYDLYLNGDQSECMIIERYRDSEAAMGHAANLGDLFPAVLATVSEFTGSRWVSRVDRCLKRMTNGR